MLITSITPANRQQFLDDNKSKFVIVVFDAEFTAQQDIVQNAVESLKELAQANNNVVVATADVEENSDFATEQSILSVPVILLISPDSRTKKKIDTFEAGKLIRILKEEIIKHQKVLPSNPVGDGLESKEANKTNLKEYLEYLTNRAPVMIFMKGEPEAPRCGFSKQLTAMLAKHDIKYESFDILEDEQVRQGLKEHSDWPTYPQVYVKGEFFGGLDILKQMEESGELKSTLTP